MRNEVSDEVVPERGAGEQPSEAHQTGLSGKREDGRDIQKVGPYVFREREVREDDP